MRATRTAHASLRYRRAGRSHRVGADAAHHHRDTRYLGNPRRACRAQVRRWHSVSVSGPERRRSAARAVWGSGIVLGCGSRSTGVASEARSRTGQSNVESSHQPGRRIRCGSPAGHNLHACMGREYRFVRRLRVHPLRRRGRGGRNGRQVGVHLNRQRQNPAEVRPVRARSHNGFPGRAGHQHHLDRLRVFRSSVVLHEHEHRFRTGLGVAEPHHHLLR